MIRREGISLPWMTVAALLSPALAMATVSLEWRPSASTVNVGGTVSLSLYAVADGSQDETMAAMDVLLAWDPAVLSLQGVVDANPAVWLTIGFPNDGALDGVNDTFADGDAYLTAYAYLGQPVVAPPSGVLVGTIAFIALTESADAALTIPATYGTFSRTQVFDGSIPGLNILGTRGTATVVVHDCGGLDEDYDEDGDVDLFDFAALQACFSGADVIAEPTCQCHFDADLDGDVDLSDYGILESALTGPMTH